MLHRYINPFYPSSFSLLMAETGTSRPWSSLNCNGEVGDITRRVLNLLLAAGPAGRHREREGGNMMLKKDKIYTGTTLMGGGIHEYFWPLCIRAMSAYQLKITFYSMERLDKRRYKLVISSITAGFFLGTARYFYKFSTYSSLFLRGDIPTWQFSKCFHAYSWTFFAV
jgi:hypothetical protein